MLLTLKQFLEARYPKGCYALSRHEAIFLGIPYPLIKGWIRVFGNTPLGDGQQRELNAMAGMKRRVARKFARELTKKEKKARQKSLALPAYQTTFQSSKEFLQTYEWRKVRMEALKQYGARCMACGAGPEHGVRIHVDHIKPRALFPHLALSLENLQVLCEECNHGKGNWDITDWREDASVS